MRKYLVVLLSVIAIIAFTAPTVHGCNRVVVRQGDDLVKVFSSENTKYIIKEDLDLDGRKVKVGRGSMLVFHGGSMANGTMVGNKTRISSPPKNIFRNCKIEGKWELDCAYSTMFDKNMDAVTLLRNLSCLSPNIKLSSKREYIINAKGEELEIESLSAEGKEKPKVRFHTVNPDVEGIKVYGKNVILKNIIFIDDYDEKNDAMNGENNVTIGNMIAVGSREGEVSTLKIIGCEFFGGTSSSFVASSQTKNCLVKDCTFSGYLGDHAVYCSKKIESFVVDNCTIKGIINTRGVFKVRSSNNIREFTIKNVKAHNLNGYMANVSLLQTPLCSLLFENITVSKDEKKDCVFYGFCVNDETRMLTGDRYNANSLIVKNCIFNYGYNGNPVIYHGAGKMGRFKEIRFINTRAINSNFAGGYADYLTVAQCGFEKCCGKNGLVPHASKITIEKTKITDKRNGHASCLFLINYDQDVVKSVTLNSVVIDADVNNMLNIVSGQELKLNVNNCVVNSIKQRIIKVFDKSVINVTEKGNTVNNNRSYKILNEGKPSDISYKTR